MISIRSRVRVGVVALLLVPGALPAFANAAPSSASPDVAVAAVTYAPVRTVVVGKGTARSCTFAALRAAVRKGGRISFDCGPKPLTIVVTKTLITCNTDTCKHPWEGGQPIQSMVLDGGGKITLSGAGVRGIFYANTCQESFGWLSSRCDLQKTPSITFRNLTFVKGNATTAPPGLENLLGGGAIAMRGGRLTLDHVTFRNNRCMVSHSDGGGGAVRVTGMTTVARVLDSRFVNNRCASGGALSSLHAAMRVERSTFTKNRATGHGASSGKGGNGGAIYYDGSGGEDVTLVKVVAKENVAPEGGSGVFYVSNDRSGVLTFVDSVVKANTGESFWTGSHHDLFFLGKRLVITRSTVA